MKQSSAALTGLLITSLALLLVACGGGDSGGESCGGDTAEVEPNDTEEMAQIIALGTTISGSGNEASDYMDYFKFVPEESRLYKVTLGCMGSNDFDLTVRGLTTPMDYPPVDAPEEGSSEVITYFMDAGSTYYIDIYAYDTGGDNGSYALNIE